MMGHLGSGNLSVGRQLQYILCLIRAGMEYVIRKYTSKPVRVRLPFGGSEFLLIIGINLCWHFADH